MAPGRKKETVRIIFGDGIMSDSLLGMLGISDTCKICYDTFHLLKFDWPKFFGLAYFETMRPLFVALVYSSTEGAYFEKLNEIKAKCQGNRQHLDYIEKEINRNRERFVRCWVTAIEGNLNRKGDSPAESNHASFAARIGDIATAEPVTAIMKMIERHEELCRVRHGQLSQHYLSCKTELSRLYRNGDHLNQEGAELMKALQNLSMGGLKIWKEQYGQAKDYEILLGPNGQVQVQRRDFDPAVNQVYQLGEGRRCPCRHRNTFLAPCRHEICSDSMSFKLERWDQRYVQRSELEVSRRARRDGRSSRQDNVAQRSTESADNTNTTDHPFDSYEPGETFDGYESGGMDSESGDDVTTKSGDVEAESGDKENTPAQHSRRQKPTYSQVHNLCTQLAETIFRSEHCETHCGMLVQMRELVAGDISSVTANVPYPEMYRKYASSFVRNRKSSQLFHSQSMNDGSDALVACTPRTAGTQHPSKKRKTNITERVNAPQLLRRRKSPYAPAEGRLNSSLNLMDSELISGKARAKGCSFCGMKDHNVATCPKLRELKGKVIAKSESRQSFAESLGCPKEHYVGKIPPALEQTLIDIDWNQQKSWPTDAFHLVVRRVYYSTNVRHAISRYATSIPANDRAENIVEVDFLRRNGDLLDMGEPKLRYYKAKNVSTMITAKKVKGKLISALGNQKSHHDESMIYY